MTKMQKWVARRVTFQLVILAVSIPDVIKVSREGGRVWLAILVFFLAQVALSAELLRALHVAKKERK